VGGILRRIKAAIGIGLTWALAWFAAGMALLLVVGPDAADVPFPLGFGLLGFLTGVTFSGLLGLVERNRRFDEMSIPRFALWGATGSALLATLFVSITDIPFDVLSILVPVFGTAGAICAGGTLALARSAEGVDAIDPGEDFADAGLTEAEKQELLGG
jgi:peptidoglycan/LPS O-acetylase OafA/YrhL